MPTTDHGDDIGEIKDHFLLHCVDFRSKAKAAVPIYAGGWELIGLCKLPSQLCREALVQSLINIEVELLGVTYPSLVHSLGADVPDVRDLTVIAVGINVDAANWTSIPVVLNGRTVSLCIRDSESVVGRNIPIQPAKVFRKRSRILCVVVIVVDDCPLGFISGDIRLWIVSLYRLCDWIDQVSWYLVPVTILIGE